VTVAYDALLASATPDFVVLAEVQPMEPLAGWTAAGGGLTNTYYCTFLSQVAAALVRGGLYRRLDEVRQNATALTSRASAALVNANLGSYFHDIANGRIYVSTTTGVSPDVFALVGAWFTLFFSTTSVSFSDQPLYAPWIAGDLPSLESRMPTSLFGVTVSDTGALTLLNGDGIFDGLSMQYVWRNKRVTFKLGGATLPYADFATVDTLRINSVAVNDEVAVLQLEDMGSILNQSLPPRTWGDGTFVGPPVTNEAIFGASQPVVFGTVTRCPTFFDGTRSYYLVDPFVHAAGVTIVAAYAVHRTYKIYTLLTPGLSFDYIVGGVGYYITILNATYDSDTYDFVVDLQSPLAAASTFGSMALALLKLCGETDADIDAAAFTAADAAAPQVLARYLGAPVQAADVLRELEQSVGGQVYKGADGRWTCRLILTDVPPTLIALTDEDFISWEPEQDLETVLNKVRVRYAHAPIDDKWAEVSASSDATLYGSETGDSHGITTWLTNANDAATLAGHLRFAASAPANVIRAEQRGLALMSAHVGDLVAVTRSRAPVARTGSYDGHLLRIVRIQKALAGPAVTVWLNDLSGQADRVGRYTDSTPIAWSTATGRAEGPLRVLCRRQRVSRRGRPRDP
jgi:hypothetical protein